MNTMHKTILLLLLAPLIYMSSCSKTASTPASIIGTWSATTQRQQLLINSIVKYDTTISVPAGSEVYSFTADGYYTIFTPSGTFGSGYILNGSTLSLFDTSSSIDKWYSVQVTTLSPHSLALQEDLFTSGDSIVRYILSFTR
jgi:hypothetical protein